MNYKQLLDEVFVMSRIIKVEVGVISRSRLAYPALIKFGRFEQKTLIQWYTARSNVVSRLRRGSLNILAFLTQEKRKKKESTAIRNMFIRFKNCAQKEANVPKKVCEEAKFPKNLEILE